LLLAGLQGENVRIFRNGSEMDLSPERKIHRINNPFSGGHEADFIRACKESPENRLLPSAHLESQLALNETILVGNIALRLQSLKRPLLWDSGQMRFSNISENEMFTVSSAVEMKFDRAIVRPDIKTVEHQAGRFVERAVRPLYRNGWPQI
jgi:hypothetical protein